MTRNSRKRKRSTFTNRKGANVRSALGYQTNGCRCRDCKIDYIPTF